MSSISRIEWTDATWNPVRGCTKVSPGCDHCYAERFAERFRGVKGHPYERGFDPHLVPEKLYDPLRWTRGRMIFVCSMSDLMHDAIPDDYIASCLGVMRDCVHHTFQVLTKRPARLRDLLCGKFRRAADLPNVWWGVTAENQEMADQRIPILLQTPAAKRFVSIEPMLGPVDFLDVDSAVSQTMRPSLAFPADVVDWVIVGGETGPGARPMNLDWVRSVRDQCKSADLPFFFKRWGDNPDAEATLSRNGDNANFGLKHCGRLLDGRTHDEFPGKSPAEI